MTTYTMPTGNAGSMRIDDNADGTLDLYFLGVNELIEQVPWTYTLNGVTESFKSFRLEANVAWQKVISLFADTTQTMTFKLGASGNIKLGGPTDFNLDIQRSDVASALVGYSRIKVGNAYVRAVPYVNDQGVWKVAQSWGKIAGIWKVAD